MVICHITLFPQSCICFPSFMKLMIFHVDWLKNYILHSYILHVITHFSLSHSIQVVSPHYILYSLASSNFWLFKKNNKNFEFYEFSNVTQSLKKSVQSTHPASHTIQFRRLAHHKLLQINLNRWKREMGRTFLDMSYWGRRWTSWFRE